MRYRSATVAGFHGLPRCLKLSKERLTAMSFRRVSPPGNARVWAFLAKSCAWAALALTEVAASIAIPSQDRGTCACQEHICES
jgi:hypothetical protein